METVPKGELDALRARIAAMEAELATERGKNEVLQDRVDVLEVEAGWDKPRLESQP